MPMQELINKDKTHEGCRLGEQRLQVIVLEDWILISINKEKKEKTCCIDQTSPNREDSFGEKAIFIWSLFKNWNHPALKFYPYSFDILIYFAKSVFSLINKGSWFSNHKNYSHQDKVYMLLK